MIFEINFSSFHVVQEIEYKNEEKVKLISKAFQLLLFNCLCCLILKENCYQDLLSYLRFNKDIRLFDNENNYIICEE